MPKMQESYLGTKSPGMRILSRVWCRQIWKLDSKASHSLWSSLLCPNSALPVSHPSLFRNFLTRNWHACPPASLLGNSIGPDACIRLSLNVFCWNGETLSSLPPSTVYCRAIYLPAYLSECARKIFRPVFNRRAAYWESGGWNVTSSLSPPSPPPV